MTPSRPSQWRIAAQFQVSISGDYHTIWSKRLVGFAFAGVFS